MRISYSAFIFTILSTPLFALIGNAQQPTSGTPTTSTQSAPQPTPATNAVTGLLKPSLDALQQTIGAVKVDKWKGGSVRAEAGSNISSIQRDLQVTLPALLKEADSAPETMSKVLPVLRNVDALYDVVLRVVDGARVAASTEQVSQLQDSLAGLDKGRRALNDRLQDMAAAQEKQVNDLQVKLKAQVAPVCPAVPVPVCPAAPVPAKKKPVKKKPTPTTPPTTQPSSSQPSTSTKPNP